MGPAGSAGSSHGQPRQRTTAHGVVSAHRLSDGEMIWRSGMPRPLEANTAAAVGALTGKGLAVVVSVGRNPPAASTLEPATNGSASVPIPAQTLALGPPRPVKPRLRHRNSEFLCKYARSQLAHGDLNPRQSTLALRDKFGRLGKKICSCLWKTFH